MDTSLVATPSGAPSSSAKSASFDHLLTSDILSDKARDLKSPFVDKRSKAFKASEASGPCPKEFILVLNFIVNNFVNHRKKITCYLLPRFSNSLPNVGTSNHQLSVSSLIFHNI